MNNSKSFSEYILKDLKTDEDIKEWLNIGFQEFLQDNDLNAFVKALEYAVRAKDTISGISKTQYREFQKKRVFQEATYMQFLTANSSRN